MDDWAAVIVQAAYRAAKARKAYILKVSKETEKSKKSNIKEENMADFAYAAIVTKPMAPGQLTVNVLGARGLTALGKFSADPFATARIDNQMHHSKPRRKTFAPVWNAKFQFKKIASTWLNLEVGISDDDKPIENHLGVARLSLGSLPSQSLHTETYVLFDDEGHERGELDLEIYWNIDDAMRESLEAEAQRSHVPADTDSGSDEDDEVTTDDNGGDSDSGPGSGDGDSDEETDEDSSDEEEEAGEEEDEEVQIGGYRGLQQRKWLALLEHDNLVSALANFKNELKQGILVTKHGRRGGPKNRTLFTDSDTFDTVSWQDAKKPNLAAQKEKTICIADVDEVRKHLHCPP